MRSPSTNSRGSPLPQPSATLPRPLGPQPPTRQRPPAVATSLHGGHLHYLRDEVPQLLDVFVEDLDYLLMGDGLDIRVTLQSDVIVGDDRDVQVAHLEFPREGDLGVLSHIDHVPSLIPEELALRPCREPRALDHDNRPPRVRLDP